MSTGENDSFVIYMDTLLRRGYVKFTGGALDGFEPDPRRATAISTMEADFIVSNIRLQTVEGRSMVCRKESLREAVAKYLEGG